MSKLKFDSTADNAGFITRMQEIQTEIDSADSALQRFGKCFDTSGIENGLNDLYKAIRENESAILQLDKELRRLKLDAEEASFRGDTASFDAISANMEVKQDEMSSMQTETRGYYDALSLAGAPADDPSSALGQLADVPQMYSSQEDYEYVESLKERISELQEQLEGMQGSEESLQPLLANLGQLQGILLVCQTEAAEAASALGDDLGTRAAEISNTLYQLNAAIENQEILVRTLTMAVETASAAMAQLSADYDPTVISDAVEKFEQLSSSLQTAVEKLESLRSVQVDVTVSFQEVNDQIEEKESKFVKMLGGYENYKTIMGTLPKPIQDAMESIKGMTGAAKAFLATPLGMALGVIVFALHSLKTWFDSTSEGQAAFAKISAVVNGVLDRMRGVMAAVGKAIYTAFTNPQEAVRKLWEVIKLNFLNRIQSVADIVKSLGGLLKAALTFDGEGVKRELKEIAKGFLQLGTGVINTSGAMKVLFDGLDGGNHNDNNENDNPTETSKKKNNDPYKPRSSTSNNHDRIEEKKEAQAMVAIVGTVAKETVTPQDEELVAEQEQINGMGEGAAKIYRQRKLDFEKERRKLKREREAAIEKEKEQLANEPDTSKLDESIKKINDLFNKKEESLKQQQKNYKLAAAKASFTSYQKEYGTYDERIKATETEYDARIAGAATAGERLSLTAKKEKEKSNLEFEKWKKGNDIAPAFGDISHLSADAIKDLTAKMEEYRDTAVETFSPDKLEEYEAALTKLRKSDIENSLREFGNLVPEYFARRLEIQKEINDATRIGNALTEKQDTLQQRISEAQEKVRVEAEKAGESISDIKLKDMGQVQELADGLLNAGEYTDQFAEGLHSALTELLELNGESAKVQKSQDSWAQKIEMLKQQLEGMDGMGRFKAICKVVAETSGIVGDLSGKMSGMFDALGNEDAAEVFGAIGDVMGSVQQVAKGFSNGIASGIIAAVGEAINWVTKLAGASDKRHEENIRDLQRQIDALQKSYENLNKAIEDAYSADASSLIGQQNTMLEQQKALIEQQIAEEESKKNSDDGKIREYREQLERIDGIIKDNEDNAVAAINGTTIKQAIDEFASALTAAWEAGADAAEASMGTVRNIIRSALTEALKSDIKDPVDAFSRYLAEAMENGTLTDAELARLDQLKAGIDAATARNEKEYQKLMQRYETLEEMAQRVTAVSFDDIRGNFRSALLDMDSDAASMADNFEGYLRTALVQGLMDSKYDGLLKEWYKRFADAMEGGELTAEEREDLRRQYQKIIEQGIADRDMLRDITGGGSYSQTSSSGGWESMGQETADELNGRFTALCITGEASRIIQADTNSVARQILTAVQQFSIPLTDTGDDTSLSAIRDMMFLSTGYLENIDSHTRHLSAIRAEITEMKNAVKQL